MDRIKTYLALSLVALTTGGSILGCNSNGGGTGGGTATAASRLCEGDSASACEESACDAAVDADCTNFAGMLSDPYLGALADCRDSGGTTTGCLVSALPSITPTAAQRAFAKQFCKECLFGLRGCEQAFFDGEGESAAAGKLILPLGDSLVDQLRTQCATGPLCAATFTGCVEMAFVVRSLPIETTKCLITSWVDGKGSRGKCGGAGSTASSGAPSSGTPTTTSSSGVGTCMPLEPGQLPDVDGCGDESLPIDGSIDAQASQFTKHHVTDTNCSMQPLVQTISPPDLEVCQYFACDAGTTEVTCPSGSVYATNALGDPGCCGVRQLAPHYDCGGASDDSAVVSYEVKPYPQCTEYSVHVSY